MRVLQSALAQQTEARPPSRYQLEAAIAALHDDAPRGPTGRRSSPGTTTFSPSATVQPTRTSPPCSGAVAVGHVLGAEAGLRETEQLREVLADRHRWHAVRGHLHELGGDLPAAATAYSEAARRATNVAERDHW